MLCVSAQEKRVFGRYNAKGEKMKQKLNVILPGAIALIIMSSADYVGTFGEIMTFCLFFVAFFTSSFVNSWFEASEMDSELNKIVLPTTQTRSLEDRCQG